MTWLTPSNSVYKYVPDVNDTMSRMLNALTSLRKYQGVITHFLWDMKLFKTSYSWHFPEYPFRMDEMKEIQYNNVNKFHHNWNLCLLATYCNWLYETSSSRPLSAGYLMKKKKKKSVEASKYFQCKPTRGCSGTIEPKRLADTPQSCVHG